MPQYTLPDWAMPNARMLAGPDMPAMNGGNMPHTSGSGSNYNDFLATEGFYQGGMGGFDARQSSHDQYIPADHAGYNSWLQSTGQELYEANEGNQSARWMQDAQGNVTSEPQVMSLNDDNFWTAAMMAAAVTGANLYGAYGGAGAAAETGGGAVAEAGGATASPVSPGTVSSSALGSGVSTEPLITASIPQAGGAAGGTSTGVGAGASAGTNPIASYLTTGASEGSTVGNWLTGAGGQSGAVGSGSSASWLQSLGSGASSLFSQGGVKSIFDIASGIYGMKLAGDARKASDPFAPYRGGYAQTLGELEANPGGIVNRPGFQAGVLAIDRSAAAKGYTGSGNAMSSLQRFGGDFYNQEAQRLAGLAGAGQTPGAGQFQSAQLASQSLASLGYGLAPYLSGGPK